MKDLEAGDIVTCNTERHLLEAGDFYTDSQGSLERMILYSPTGSVYVIAAVGSIAVHLRKTRELGDGCSGTVISEVFCRKCIKPHYLVKIDGRINFNTVFNREELWLAGEVEINNIEEHIMMEERRMTLVEKVKEWV